MYCPRCNKSIQDDRLDELKKSLKEIGNEHLMHGRCPVCGTELLSVGVRKVAAESGSRPV
ncbi:MAG: hypothetical protein M1422_06300 [Candidatus Thermoplasmatota archaeon]|jgi:uncharacterized protein with PIN domain|nr:hypothetical protein [Candidatus Sysuiplasma jiujiangense]MBX8639137.1 hypothetical protein [Candidatus Sysuiplasma jiujiangense]MBX8641470.1 hypothetical protein [Candidatus Sysuiplasma jiujiangense]MCL4317863.1 hypothetical protein [Candidatus Thermoplasmatota archaeon]MCL5254291.1 hypothetical protein [Candidatus Thermoplasmatota archaeon]